MGLDEFRSENVGGESEEPELDEETRQDLIQEEPPSDADSWSEHEPGEPDWTEDTRGEEFREDRFKIKDKRIDSALISKLWVDLTDHNNNTR